MVRSKRTVLHSMPVLLEEMHNERGATWTNRKATRKEFPEVTTAMSARNGDWTGRRCQLFRRLHPRRCDGRRRRAEGLRSENVHSGSNLNSLAELSDRLLNRKKEEPTNARCSESKQTIRLDVDFDGRDINGTAAVHSQLYYAPRACSHAVETAT